MIFYDWWIGDSNLNYSMVMTIESTYEEIMMIHMSTRDTKPSSNNDFIIGNDGGNDSIDGLLGNDTIKGLAGKDTLIGSLGNDSLDGGNHNDILSGDAGTDTLIGGGGNDKLDGGADNDRLQGDAGNDTLIGGFGADTMDGGIGNDNYAVDHLNDMVIEPDGKMGGMDSVTSSVNFNLDTSAKNVENLIIIGSTVSTLNGTGNDSANKIVGHQGNNSLIGMSGNDTLLGFQGNDTLDGGIGVDSLVGGDGSDTYVVTNTEDIIVETTIDGDMDVIQSKVTYTLGDNLERLFLTDTAMGGTGNILNNMIDGSDVSNNLLGMDGNDTLYGNGGNDTLDGGIGDDSIDGGDGDDTVYYQGTSDFYQFIYDESGSLIVKDAYSADGLDEGTDTLVNVEFLTFSNMTGPIEAFL